MGLYSILTGQDAVDCVIVLRPRIVQLMTAVADAAVAAAVFAGTVAMSAHQTRDGRHGRRRLLVTDTVLSHQMEARCSTSRGESAKKRRIRTLTSLSRTSHEKMLGLSRR